MIRGPRVDVPRSRPTSTGSPTSGRSCARLPCRATPRRRASTTSSRRSTRRRPTSSSTATAARPGAIDVDARPGRRPHRHQAVEDTAPTFDPTAVPEPDLSVPALRRRSGRDGHPPHPARDRLDRPSTTTGRWQHTDPDARRSIPARRRSARWPCRSPSSVSRAASRSRSWRSTASSTRRTSSASSRTVRGAVRRRRPRHLLLDLTGLTFMASSGLVALHSVVRVMHGEEPPDPEGGWGALPRVDRRRRRRGTPDGGPAVRRPARGRRACWSGPGSTGCSCPIPIARPPSPRSDATSRSAMTDPGAALDPARVQRILAPFARRDSIACRSRWSTRPATRSPSSTVHAGSPGDGVHRTPTSCWTSIARAVSSDGSWRVARATDRSRPSSQRSTHWPAGLGEIAPRPTAARWRPSWPRGGSRSAASCRSADRTCPATTWRATTRRLARSAVTSSSCSGCVAARRPLGIVIADVTGKGIGAGDADGLRSPRDPRRAGCITTARPMRWSGRTGSSSTRSAAACSSPRSPAAGRHDGAAADGQRGARAPAARAGRRRADQRRSRAAACSSAPSGPWARPSSTSSCGPGTASCCTPTA